MKILTQSKFPYNDGSESPMKDSWDMEPIIVPVAIAVLEGVRRRRK